MKEIFIDELSDEFLTNKEFISSFYDGNSFEISLLFKSDFKNAKKLREFLFIILDIIGVSIIWKNRFVIILDELVNNAIEHGSSPNSINKVNFYAKNDNNTVKINLEVKDTGDGISAKKAIEMEELRKEKKEKGFDGHKSIRGRGLFLIISGLVDTLYFKDRKDGGLTVGVEKNIKLV